MHVLLPESYHPAVSDRDKWMFTGKIRPDYVIKSNSTEAPIPQMVSRLGAVGNHQNMNKPLANSLLQPGKYDTVDFVLEYQYHLPESGAESEMAG